MRHTSFSFALDLTPEQVQVALRHAGAARFAFNQGLSLLNAAYQKHKEDNTVKVPYSGFDLINAFNRWKVSADAGVDDKGTPGLGWRGGVLAQVFEEALVDLSRGVKGFFDNRKKTGKRHVGFPKFKKKHRAKLSFRIRHKRNEVRVGVDGITLPILGGMRVRHSTRSLRRMLRSAPDGTPRAKILFATLSCTAERWFVRINVKAADFHPSQRHAQAGGPALGIDRGLNKFVVAGNRDGELFLSSEAPKPLTRGIRTIRRWSRNINKHKKKGSKNMRRAQRKLAKRHARMANIRKAYVHNLSRYVVKTHAHVALEDLNIAGMVKNRCLARGIMDSAWGMFARQVEYKAAWYNALCTKVDRFFPSSKRCHKCHWVAPSMPLNERTFHCAHCGLTCDRDLNAAANVAQAGERVAAKQAETLNDCRGESTGRGRKAATNLTSRPCGNALMPTQTRTKKQKRLAYTSLSPVKGGVDTLIVNAL